MSRHPLRFFPLALLFATLSTGLHAQTTAPAAEEAPAEPEIKRPAKSDASSLRLISNYLAASGGRPAHARLDSVTAFGTIKEGITVRDFKITETRDGRRLIVYTWKEEGRMHEQRYVTDGKSAWTQTVKPEEQPARDLGDVNGKHFMNQFWFLHPFIGKRFDDYVFEYRGDARVATRPAYLVVGYGPDNVRTWFYFDKETFLVTRHGGIGSIANVEKYLDCASLRFKRQGSLLFATEIELLAGRDPYGHVVINKIQPNLMFDPADFERPASREVWMRQRPVQP